MDSRLNRILDWAARAEAAGYDQLTLARLCLISPSQMRRYFLLKHGKTPQCWMNEMRLKKAADMLLTGRHLVKEIAIELHYDYISNFCRQFKAFYGCCPTDYLLRKTPECANGLPWSAAASISNLATTSSKYDRTATNAHH